MKRILVAGLYHETHTFLQGVTSLEDCKVRRGNALLRAAGDGSLWGAALETALRAGWQVTAALDLRAAPGPPLADEAVQTFWMELERVLRENLPRNPDGILLLFHGAAVSQSLDDVEGEILQRIRHVLGKRRIPVVGVLDLHANFSRAMAENADALIAYRENPHADAAAAAVRAAKLLGRLIHGGERLTTVWVHPPLLWPPTGTDTHRDPMRSLEARAREIERRRREILAVNVLAGFAFTDVPDAGVSFTAATRGDPEAARAELLSLAALAEELKELGNVQELPVAEVMPKVAACRQGPVILAEPSDNIGAGAPGDGTGLLRALLEYQIPNAVLVLHDPQAVSRLAGRPVGSHVILNLGGKGSPLDPGPLALEIELISQSNGRFPLEDPRSHLASMVGTLVEMGPCAVVRHRNLTILLTSKKTPPFDLGQLRSQGIEPEKQFAIVVKAAVAHRRAYDPIAAASYSLDTPGPCSSRLKNLPYRKVRRPIFPLDD
jgi:microcystin degradation protein MlrC